MLRTILGITFSCVVAAAPARADTLLVPQDYATIQAALVAAVSGDVVLIKGGEYAESVSATVADGVTVEAKGRVRIDASGLGVAFAVTGQSLQVTGIEVTGGTDGFVIGGANAVLEKCVVTGVTGRGFVVSGSKHVFRKCRVESAGGDGIALTDTSACQLHQCTVRDVQGSGITLGAQSFIAYVRSCRIQRPGANGIVNDSGGGGVDGVKILEPGANGVVDNAPLGVPGNYYLAVRVKKAVGDGIRCSGGRSGLYNCTITDPGGAGIDASASSVTAKHNLVKHAGSDGFRITGFDGLWSSNMSTGAAGNGFVLGGAGNILSLNTGRKSGGFDLLEETPGQNVVASDNDFGTTSP